eukprot:scaffold273_cov349-Prasinococcus_capsulatus_cf.AAC.14
MESVANQSKPMGTGGGVPKNRIARTARNRDEPLFKRPRGRAPSGKIWDFERGGWKDWPKGVPQPQPPSASAARLPTGAAAAPPRQQPVPALRTRTPNGGAALSGGPGLPRAISKDSLRRALLRLFKEDSVIEFLHDEIVRVEQWR